jgi:hypothetical protein
MIFIPAGRSRRDYHFAPPWQAGPQGSPCGSFKNVRLARLTPGAAPSLSPLPYRRPSRNRLFAKYLRGSKTTTVFRRFDKSTLFLCTLSSTNKEFFYFFKPQKTWPKAIYAEIFYIGSLYKLLNNQIFVKWVWGKK